jgi:hypothetical protein
MNKKQMKVGEKTAGSSSKSEEGGYEQAQVKLFKLLKKKGFNLRNHHI